MKQKNFWPAEKGVILLRIAAQVAALKAGE